MRIVKLNILESKTNLRPRDLIQFLYPGMISRLSAFQFAFHPRGNKVFKGHRRVRNSLEEQSIEEWSRKKKVYCGYLQRKSYEFQTFKKRKVESNFNWVKLRLLSVNLSHGNVKSYLVYGHKVHQR